MKALVRLIFVSALILPPSAPALAGVVDVQFAGDFSFHCPSGGNNCATPTQTGSAVIGSSGGLWNSFSPVSAAGATLVDVSGAASSMAISYSAANGYASGTYPSAFGTTQWANLMGGYLVAGGGNSINVTLSGLAAGQSYGLYVYDQGDGNAAGRSLDVTANGATQSATQTGAGTFIQGNNYLYFAGVANPLGDIVISGVPISNSEADINGLQIVTNAVPEPAPLAILGIGLLGMAAIRRRNRVN